MFSKCWTESDSRKPKVIRQFLCFGIVGTVGFIVDVAVLYGMLKLGAGFAFGRIVSFMSAVTCTWYLNRQYTFTGTSQRATHQWLRFALVNSIGGAVNYSLYLMLVYSSSIVMRWPLLGVAAGSLAGLVINFTLSRILVFRAL